MKRNTIYYNGCTYYESRRIWSDTKTYIEYRNDELQKIKYLELKEENLVEISDEEDLKEAIGSNSNLFDGVVE